jgi:hypothetical protein
MPNFLYNYTHPYGMANEKEDKSTWAIGGGLLAGFGVGLFFLQENPLAFVGSMIAGLGIGLVLTSIISSRQRQK